MRISDFSDFIHEIPYKYQSERISAFYWEGFGLDDLVKNLPQSEGVVTINRTLLYNSNKDIRKFVLATLMWGYPTLGRGGYIKAFLRKGFDQMVTDLTRVGVEGNLTAQDLRALINSHHGIGISTFTKFFHFMNVSFETQPISILDMQIIEIMKVRGFHEMETIPEIKYGNINHLKAYLEWFNGVQKELGCHKDQLEMFIFWFGRHLSK